MNALVMIAGILLLPGCTTTIIPPGAVQDPVPVFLLDHGRTPSLVIPAAGGGMTRYAYGDWRYYALRQNDALNGLWALLLPTQGTLGRGQIKGAMDEETIRRGIPPAIDHVYAIRVERSRVDALRERLEAMCQDHSATKVVNEAYGMEFVHHPDAYIFFHNSNHVAAAWLRDLGCGIRGWAFFSRWQVEEGCGAKATNE